MNSFDSLDELWLDAAQQIEDNGHETGSRDGESKEVLGYVGRLAVPQANWLFNPVRKAKLYYGAAEFLWYMSGESHIGLVKEYAPQYTRFVEGPADDGINAHGAYGARLAGSKAMQATVEKLRRHNLFPAKIKDPISQIRMIAWLLKEKPDTRQAISIMWNDADLPHALSGSVGDLPCTIGLQFILRNGHLNCIATMRSNDIWLGLPYDVFCFTMMQQFLAHLLQVEVGWYQHQVGSLHVYKRNYEKFKDAMDPGMFSTEYLQFSHPHVPPVDAIKGALTLEQNFRESGTLQMPTLEKIGALSIMGQMALWTMIRWCETHRYEPKNLLKHIHNQEIHKLARKQCR